MASTRTSNSIVRFGFKCRFLGGHISTDENGNLDLAVDEERKARTTVSMHEVNYVGGEVLKMLRSKKVCEIFLGYLSQHSHLRRTVPYSTH